MLSAQAGEHRRRSLVAGTANCPAQLTAVGRLGRNAVPRRASGGLTLNLEVTSRLTDLHTFQSWWIELPDVEDVASQQRGRKILVEVIPLGDPSTATLMDMGLGQCGRIIYHRYNVAAFRDGEDFFGVVSGCIPSSTVISLLLLLVVHACKLTPVFVLQDPAPVIHNCSK